MQSQPLLSIQFLDPSMRKLFATTLLAMTVLGLPFMVSADEHDTTTSRGDTGVASQSAQNIFDFAGRARLGELATLNQAQTRFRAILNTVLSLLALIAVVLIVYAGLLWVTAAGSDEQVKKAKNILRGTLIAMVVIGLAFAVITFVITVVTPSATR